MAERSAVEAFFDQYEDLAVQVVDDQRPNTSLNIDMSNIDMAEYICHVMDWEDFNLFDEFDFQGVYDRAQPQEVLAYCYLAYLRWELFSAANEMNIGDKGFNDKASAHSELWFGKLIDKYVSISTGETLEHVWVN